MKISVIIIGRNEAQNLNKCIISVQKLNSQEIIDSFEIIYVDSDSNDNSIEIAKKSGVDRIVKITEFYNAAVARNVGAELAQHETLFFLDADMLIQDVKFSLLDISLFNDNIIAGEVVEYILNADGIVAETYIRKYPERLTGGNFIISKSIYNKLGGMDELLKKGQDYDLFLRAYKAGYHLVRDSNVQVQHFTQSYQSKERARYQSLSSYYRGYLLRKNFTNSLAHKLTMTEFYPIYFLLCVVLITPFTSKAILIPSLVLFAISIGYKIKQNLRMDLYVYIFLRQFIFLMSIFTFFPKKGESHIEVIK